MSTDSISTIQFSLALRVLKFAVIAACPLLTQLVMAVKTSSQIPLPVILALNSTEVNAKLNYNSQVLHSSSCTRFTRFATFVPEAHCEYLVVMHTLKVQLVV